MTTPGRILSLGQGSRTVDEFISELRRHQVAYLIDVRSVPHSSYRPEFSRDALEKALRSSGLRYVFMGDLLGGKPEDTSCYVNGRVDYVRCRQAGSFQRGLARLKHAHEQGLTVCLMCSEGEPSQCHRSKLIGVALADLGIEVSHIKASGEVARQPDVIAELTGGQSSLFGEPLRSRRTYLR